MKKTYIDTMMKKGREVSLPKLLVEEDLNTEMIETAKRYGMSMPDYRRWCYRHAPALLHLLNELDMPPRPITSGPSTGTSTLEE